jgi:hypothetical protein
MSIFDIPEPTRPAEACHAIIYLIRSDQISSQPAAETSSSFPEISSLDDDTSFLLVTV